MTNPVVKSFIMKHKMLTISFVVIALLSLLIVVVKKDVFLETREVVGTVTEVINDCESKLTLNETGNSFETARYSACDGGDSIKVEGIDIRTSAGQSISYWNKHDRSILPGEAVKVIYRVYEVKYDDNSEKSVEEYSLDCNTCRIERLN